MLLAGFALSRTLWLSGLILVCFCAGITAIIVTAMTTSLVQLIVPDHLRGRVVSIYMVAFRGYVRRGARDPRDQRRAAFHRRRVLSSEEPRGQRAVTRNRFCSGHWRFAAASASANIARSVGPGSSVPPTTTAWIRRV